MMLSIMLLNQMGINANTVCRSSLSSLAVLTNLKGFLLQVRRDSKITFLSDKAFAVLPNTINMLFYSYTSHILAIRLQ